MTKQLQFKQFAVIFNESSRQVDIYGLTDGGTLYKQRNPDRPEEGFEAISTHRYDPPKAERPVSKSMQRDKGEV